MCYFIFYSSYFFIIIFLNLWSIAIIVSSVPAYNAVIYIISELISNDYCPHDSS